MSKDKKKEVPPARLRFTEEVQENEEMSATESMGTIPKLHEELNRLEELPHVAGYATIGMIEQYRNFPWTQDTMLSVGRGDEILKGFLHKHIKIGTDTLEE